LAANQDLFDDAVIFWHAVEYRLQKLAVLTKAYITMPVTSADVESSFSKFASVLFPLHQSLVS